MTNFKILIKKNFYELINRFRGRKHKKTFWGGVFTLIAGVLALLALYAYQARTMFVGLGKGGLEDLCLFHAFVITLPVMIIIGVMRVSGKNTDNDKELLLSLPIKKVEIILSKIINRYLYDLFFSVLLLTPFIVFYQVYTKFSLWISIGGGIVIFILPLLSVGISCILDFIIRSIFNRIKNGDILKTILSIFIYIGVMILMLLKTVMYGKVKTSTMEAFFEDRFFSNLFLKFLLSPNLKNSLGVILLCLLPFILGLILYSLTFGKSYSKFRTKNLKLKFNSYKNSFSLLLKKEFLSYLNTPAWVINSIIGPIFILSLGVLTVSGQLDGVLGLLGKKDTILILGVLLILINIMNSTSVISCCSISLEGKNLWILKSSPVNEKELFLAKILTHVFIVIPEVIVSVVLICIKFRVKFMVAVLAIVFCSLFVFINAYGGLLINLLFPQINFQEETNVIKQGMSSLVSIFGGIILAIVPIIIKLLFKISLIKIGLISVFIYLLILILIIIALNKVGRKLFQNLENN